jgi:hypothetical protein
LTRSGGHPIGIRFLLPYLFAQHTWLSPLPYFQVSDFRDLIEKYSIPMVLYYQRTDGRAAPRLGGTSSQTQKVPAKTWCRVADQSLAAGKPSLIGCSAVPLRLTVLAVLDLPFGEAVQPYGGSVR